MTDLAALTAPFDPSVVKWRPGTTTKDKTKALALAYVDARNVMQRLDDAVGSFDWSDTYRPLPDGSVECTLTIIHAGVSKTDVGYSNAPGTDKEDEPLKAAYSDAFKRAAVKFGIGRDLYDTPQFWLPLNQYGRFDAVPVYKDGQWQLPGADTTSTPARKTPQRGSTATTEASAQVVSANQNTITDGQRAKLLATCKTLGLTEPQIKGALAIVAQKKSSKDLTVTEFEAVLARLDDPKFVDSLREIEAVAA